MNTDLLGERVGLGHCISEVAWIGIVVNPAGHLDGIYVRSATCANEDNRDLVVPRKRRDHG